MNSKVIVGILIAFIAISFLTIGRNPLLNDDAASYALAAKNAIVHKMWLTQFFTPGDMMSFEDKPPLGIWMLAWFPQIAGVSELTIHIPNLIYYALIIWLVYFFVNKHGGKETALYSAVITATSLALVTYSRTPKLDVPLALFTTAANFLLFDFLISQKAKTLYFCALMIACAFLVKSGFGLVMPGLTIAMLFLISKEAREVLLKTFFSVRTILAATIFLLAIVPIIGLQALALGEYFSPYWRSITVQSRYNDQTLIGFGPHYQVLGFLLITAFPWMPLFFSSLKLKLWQEKLGLRLFSQVWFWATFLFLFFLYKQTDYRTMTIFVAPMAVLAGYQLQEKPRLSSILWNLFYIVIFCLIFYVGLTKGTNQDGFDITAALVPIGLFVISLISLQFFFQKPETKRLAVSFGLICFAYSVLFYNTLPLANAFNPDVTWPGIIKQYQQEGYKFVIFRPRDRKLSFSPDLFYVDYLAGPADRYFWEGDKLNAQLTTGKAILLSDTESLKKHRIKPGRLLAEDNYSRLVKY